MHIVIVPFILFIAAVCFLAVRSVKKVKTVVVVKPRARYPFYIYQKVSEKNYRLKGTVMAVDAYDACVLWHGTEWKPLEMQIKRHIGISAVHKANKRGLVSCHEIEPHFTYTYIGW